jgi:hypothetical protein
VDDADRAQPNIEHAVEDGLAEARLRLGHDLAPKGECHYCDSPVPAGHLFCDLDCSRAYDHERALRRMAGVK